MEVDLVTYFMGFCFAFFVYFTFAAIWTLIHGLLTCGGYWIMFRSGSDSSLFFVGDCKLRHWEHLMSIFRPGC